ncbi:hypothetical protein UlMin_027472 [Ulmus minor]
MRFSSASVPSSSKEVKSPNQTGPRLRKKHKRLDAICEKEYKRNHSDLSGSCSGVGIENNDLEIRRSSRVRRAPVVLDLSPPPPKKRRKSDKNVVLSGGKSVKGSPQVSADLEDSEVPGSWKSRLRTRRRNVVFWGKRELDSPSRKRKLFEELSGNESEEHVMGSELGNEKGESATGKSTVFKSTRPRRIKATNGSNNEEKLNELFDIKNEVAEVEQEVVEDEGEEVALQLDCGIGDGKERQTSGDDNGNEAQTSSGDNGNERVTIDGNTIGLDETEENLPLEDGCICDNTMETIDDIQTIEEVEKQAEQLDSAIEGENQNDVVELNASSANDVEGSVLCDEKNETCAMLDGKPHVKENDAKGESSKCASSVTLGKPRIKEGRRCGLCGGGSNGKPPKTLAPDAGESENEAYSGSSASEEPNYDMWDGFGDEPGWLGRLLGPINDRYGIAGIWVHQNCAVWSPEVYFAGLGRLKNVRAALCRGRALKCTRCGRPGATIGCRVDRCPKTYHLPCARANGCIFDHRKFLIACTDHRYHFQPYGVQYLAKIKKMKAKKMKLELRKLSNDACRKDIEAEEKWFENCGEDEEFLKRESKRLHRDLVRIAPVYIGGPDSDDGKSFQGWESVAGLQDVIRCMKEVVILPLLYPEFFDSLGSTPPRGVLLHGHPGTGKTLVVRALIGACARGDKRIAYFARKGADCLGKYVGDAERQLRLLFQVAEKCQPSIIFFDEIDGLAPCRTRHQDQTHSSVVSTLLALLDGLKSRGSVVVIGATNRPDAVDPALRRPGRFDREIYFPLPSVKDRAAILSLHTERWPKPVSGSLLQWIARKTTGFAGADLQALCTQAAITGLKRNFPLQEILSAAAAKASSGKHLPLPKFTVEEKDWLEALSLSPPPCSRREAGIAANEIVSSPLPIHLSPCLLQPLSNLLVSLYLDERLFLPASLTKAAIMIKSVIISALDKKKLSSDCWWSFIDDCFQEPEIAKEIERHLLNSGILHGDTDMTCNNDCDADAGDNIMKFKPSMNHNGSTHSKSLQYMSFPSSIGFRILIAGSPRSGQRHLASCLLHCFVGNIEIHKVDLATISQEGHGDVVQGITRILNKCTGVGSCMVFMPRIDLWAVKRPQQLMEESDSCSVNHQSLDKDNLGLTQGQVVEDENVCSPERSEPQEMGGDQGVIASVSDAWNLFVEQVELICVSTSLMIMATSDLPYSLLPERIRQFFQEGLSNRVQSTHMKHTVPRFLVQTDGQLNYDLAINLSSAELSKDVVQQLVHLIHQRSHIHKTSCEEHRFSDSMESHTLMVNKLSTHGSHKAQDGKIECNDDSAAKAPLPPNNKTVKGRSNLLLAISSFGYQILRYPHFAELCWVTSKLKEGPSADISGPWKGWPFNSCIVRPTNSLEKVVVGCSSRDVKTKEKFGIVRGLIAVGLSAYRGVYTSLREVSFEVRKVFELLVRQINAKVLAGKDRNQYVRILSQVAYLEDMVYSWTYTLQSLEVDPPTIAANSKLEAVSNPDNHLLDSQVQCEEGEPNIPNKFSNESEVLEKSQQGFAAEKVVCIDLNKEYDDFSDSQGIEITERSQEKVSLLDTSTLDKPVHNSNEANLLVGKPLNEQNGTHIGPSESGKERNNVVVDGDSGPLEHSNGFAITDSTPIFENGHGPEEVVEVKHSSAGTASSQVLAEETSNEPKADAHQNNLTDNFSTETTKPGDLCLYRCCSECLNILRNLTQKILIREWKSNRSHWTVEDVHDVVASLSVDLLSAISRISHEKQTQRYHEKLFDSPDQITCRCNCSGNGKFEPTECSCHSTSHTSKADISLNQPELKFIFRDGVLVHTDPNDDKGVSFHCKFETLCLCSLIDSIVTTKHPFD